MMQSIYWNFAFNVLVNSTLMFITMAVLVEFTLFVLRVKQQRVKAICRTLPMFKLGMDLYLYNFSDWALMEGLNPIIAQPGSRMLSLMLGISAPELTSPPSLITGIQLFLNNEKTFTLADLAILSIDSFWIKSIVLIVLTVSLGLFLLRCYKLIISHGAISNLLKASQASSRIVINQSLSLSLQKSKVKVLVSRKAPVPLAIGIFQKRIVFPAGLIDKLTQQEYEAVIAHELGHLRWYDAIIRFFAHLIFSIFWWIPSKRWVAHLEHTQERGCDNSVSSYDISRMALARAIVKSAKQAKSGAPPLSALCFVRQNQILGRMQAILNETRPKKRIVRSIPQYICVFGCMMAFLFGKFWIF